ncbi:hypothetical protein ACFORL_03715 [Legionella dresdenensis]|uniref:Interaptin n=1 Tax=Legionella dresdenensis TaxID=450200 RepID=A0ABV8CD79_9GAMM
MPTKSKLLEEYKAFNVLSIEAKNNQLSQLAILPELTTARDFHDKYINACRDWIITARKQLDTDMKILEKKLVQPQSLTISEEKRLKQENELLRTQNGILTQFLTLVEVVLPLLEKGKTIAMANAAANAALQKRPESIYDSLKSTPDIEALLEVIQTQAQLAQTESEEFETKKSRLNNPSLDNLKRYISFLEQQQAILAAAIKQKESALTKLQLAEQAALGAKPVKQQAQPKKSATLKKKRPNIAVIVPANSSAEANPGQLPAQSEARNKQLHTTAQNLVPFKPEQFEKIPYIAVWLQKFAKEKEKLRQNLQNKGYPGENIYLRQNILLQEFIDQFTPLQQTIDAINERGKLIKTLKELKRQTFSAVELDQEAKKLAQQRDDALHSISKANELTFSPPEPPLLNRSELHQFQQVIVAQCSIISNAVKQIEDISKQLTRIEELFYPKEIKSPVLSDLLRNARELYAEAAQIVNNCKVEYKRAANTEAAVRIELQPSLIKAELQALTALINNPGQNSAAQICAMAQVHLQKITAIKEVINNDKKILQTNEKILLANDKEARDIADKIKGMTEKLSEQLAANSINQHLLADYQKRFETLNERAAQLELDVTLSHTAEESSDLIAQMRTLDTKLSALQIRINDVLEIRKLDLQLSDLHNTIKPLYRRLSTTHNLCNLNAIETANPDVAAQIRKVLDDNKGSFKVAYTSDSFIVERQRAQLTSENHTQLAPDMLTQRKQFVEQLTEIKKQCQLLTAQTIQIIEQHQQNLLSASTGEADYTPEMLKADIAYCRSRLPLLSALDTHAISEGNFNKLTDAALFKFEDIEDKRAFRNSLFDLLKINTSGNMPAGQIRELKALIEASEQKLRQDTPELLLDRENKYSFQYNGESYNITDMVHTIGKPQLVQPILTAVKEYVESHLALTSGFKAGANQQTNYFRAFNTLQQNRELIEDYIANFKHHRECIEKARLASEEQERKRLENEEQERQKLAVRQQQLREAAPPHKVDQQYMDRIKQHTTKAKQNLAILNKICNDLIAEKERLFHNNRRDSRIQIVKDLYSVFHAKQQAFQMVIDRLNFLQANPSRITAVIIDGVRNDNANNRKQLITLLRDELKRENIEKLTLESGWFINLINKFLRFFNDSQRELSFFATKSEQNVYRIRDTAIQELSPQTRHTEADYEDIKDGHELTPWEKAFF